MLHHILVKWKERPEDAAGRLREVEEIFLGALSVPGVQAVRIIPNVIDRPNRFDLMIVLTMDRDALPAYDACEAHHLWKQRYSGLIDQKAIFDCD